MTPYVHPIRAAIAEAYAAITPREVPPPRFADLRDGGNMPRKPRYRWTDWHTAGLILSGLLIAVMAIILESVI